MSRTTKRCLSGWILLLLLALLFTASDSIQPAGSHRSLPAVQSNRSFLLLSPNTDEDLLPDEALRRLRRREQALFHRLVIDLAAKGGLGRVSVCDALGDWSDGLENSLLTDVVHAPDMNTLQYVAAIFGQRARQKSVLVFRADRTGEDEMAILEIPERDLCILRRQLDKHHIPFRTLVPIPGGHRVVVLDQRRQSHERIVGLASDYGVRVEFLVGRSNALGAESRSEAQAVFLHLIEEYEQRNPQLARSKRTVPASTPNSFPILAL